MFTKILEIGEHWHNRQELNISDTFLNKQNKLMKQWWECKQNNPNMVLMVIQPNGGFKMFHMDADIAIQKLGDDLTYMPGDIACVKGRKENLGMYCEILKKDGLEIAKLDWITDQIATEADDLLTTYRDNPIGFEEQIRQINASLPKNIRNMSFCDKIST